MEQAMHYTKLISDYLEGFLDETHEASLFGTLAQRPDLRSEFGSQLAMQKAMLGDIQHVTVPEDAMKGVFGTLGFATPATVALTTASTVTAITPVTRSFSALWSALGASVITAIVMWSLLRPDTSSEQIAVVNTPSPNPVQMVSPVTNSEHSTSTQVVTPKETVREVTRYINTGISAADVERVVHSRIAEERERIYTELRTKTPTEEQVEMNGTINTVSPKSQRIHSESTSGVLQSLRIAQDEYRANETNFALYLRSTPSLSFPQVNDVGDNLSVKNYALTGMYIFPGSEHLVGIEAGAENFSQVFTTKVSGVEETYEQNPTYGFVGVSYRFMPYVGFAEYFRPFIHVTAGATEVGPMGKASLGVSYQPETMIELMLGGDMSALYYPTSKDWQISRKAGFTFGAGIKF